MNSVPGPSNSSTDPPFNPRRNQRRKTVVSIQLPTQDSTAQPQLFKPGVPADDEKDENDEENDLSDPLMFVYPPFFVSCGGSSRL